MKLLFVTSIKEQQEAVGKLLSASGIHVFSVTETTGIKDHPPVNMLDEWFSAGKEKFDSVFLFSFTDSQSADNAIEAIKAYNIETNNHFPVRAFILPVEKSSY
ncbi:MAG: hypothetical protein ACOYKE_12185 [Ferruginibacter sp.]